MTRIGPLSVVVGLALLLGVPLASGAETGPGHAAAAVPIPLGSAPVTLSPPSNLSWSQFRFNATHQGLSPLGGPANGTIQWRISVGPSSYYNSPIESGNGTIYTAGYALIASDVNGSRIWYWGAPHAVSVLTDTPALLRNGTPIVGSVNGLLLAVQPTYFPIWEALFPPYHLTATVSSPTIAPSGRIYIGSDDGYLFALSPQGKQIWRFGTGGYVQSSPAVAPDGTIYVGSFDGKLYSVRPNGTERWAYATGGPVFSSPAIAPSGAIFVGSEDGSVYALDPNGTLAWSYATAGSVLSSPAIGADGTVYIGSNDGSVYAFAPNGTLRWSYTTGGAIFSSPAVDANGSIFVGSDDGYLYALHPNGSLEWRVDLGSPVHGSPIIGLRDSLYVTTSNGSLVALSDHGTTRIRFAEVGLPSGTPWNVTIGGVAYGTRLPTIGIRVPTSSLGASWSIAPVPCGSGCEYVAMPSSGSLSAPHGSSIRISFVLEYWVQTGVAFGSHARLVGAWYQAGTNLSLSTRLRINWIFVNWTSTSPLLVIGNASATSTYVLVGGSGTVEAVYVALVGGGGAATRGGN
ncbi:MAG TPA: PQQ-binding-like beta-propeller repeat protein [Thermoplasmata archaeon]|nr:PQQ-binding-like beta-propeller repeat protein [Thermoplasmata archaeon]